MLFVKSADRPARVCCPGGCGTLLRLRDCESRASLREFEIAGIKVSVKTLCRYYCEAWACVGSKHGFPVEDDGHATGIQLGGRGRAPAGEGVLAICLACQPWAAHHASRGDCTLLQGICKDSMQLYLDEVRRAQARLGREEQTSIIFTAGMLVEWDECGVRCERRSCARPCTQCDNCQGYRLLWNRWLIGVERGNRSHLVVKQLSWKTSEAAAGGVPLDGDDCDACCLPHLSIGVVNLTDGASAYEAFADGEIACSPSCERKDCLTRARALGSDRCVGWRPRTGRDRFERHYKALCMAHGVVSHNKKEWSLIKRVVVHDAHGKKRVIHLKHGTECADGAWAEIKSSFPNSLGSHDHERIADYIYSWAWRARKHSSDLFSTLGGQLRC